MTDPSRHAWSRPGLWGRCRCPFSTNCSVGQALAFGANQGQIGAGCVLNPEFGTVGVTEIELGQIPGNPRRSGEEVRDKSLKR